MSGGAGTYLEVYLGPFLDHLQRPDVTDLYINRPGELWVETLSGGTERHVVAEIDDALAMRLARQIASITHQGISREHPLLAATLPDGSRVQIAGPPATRGPMAIAIRKHVSSDMSLDDYEAQGAFADARRGPRDHESDIALSEHYRARRWKSFFRLAVRSRKTIIVSGGTSTGKTTFLNALMREIDEAERLVLIEDTPELVMRHQNAVGLIAVRGDLGEAKVSTDDLLIASLRMRPDRIIVGEIRGSEAFTFLRAVNTGHPGSLTTVHADTPARAIEQLSLLVLQTGSRMSRADIVGYLHNVIDITVQLDRSNGRRIVSEVFWRDGETDN